MDAYDDNHERNEIKKIFCLFDGLSDEALKAIEYAYDMGRSDTLAELGIEESDLPSGQGFAAWAT